MINILTAVVIGMKRVLKHPGILAMLAVIPLTAYIYTNIAQKNEGASVGIYDSGNAGGILNGIKEDSDIKFVLYTDKEQMRADVETQKLECGFILPDDMEKLTDGTAEIVYGEGRTSVMSGVTKEAIFSAVLKYYGGSTALNFAKRSGMDIDEARFAENYSHYLSSIKSAVEFEETAISANDASPKDNTVSCIIAAITFCAGLTGAVLVISDRKKGIVFLSGTTVASVMVFFVLAEVLAFFIIGFRPDILRLCFLNMGVWGICCVISRLLRDVRIPRLLMPLCMALILVFDYIGAAEIVPSLRPVEKILLSHYYIYSDIVWLAAAAIVFGTLGAAANFFDRRRV